MRLRRSEPLEPPPNDRSREEIYDGIEDPLPPLTLPFEIDRLAGLHRLYLKGEIHRHELWSALLGTLLPRLARGPQLLERRLEGWPEPPPSVVLTTYFASKVDPQTDFFVPREDIHYIAPWYQSLRATGDYGIVFHDHLSRGFVSRWQTDRIRFLRCRLGDYNLNDERFLLYLAFLLDHPCDAAFATDGTDVLLTRSPFGLLPGLLPQDGAPRLFVGRDRFNLNGHSGWIARMARGYEERTGRRLAEGFAESPMYNAGVVGGPYYTTLYFLVRMAERLLALATPDEYDMFVLNYTIFRHFLPRRAPLGLFRLPFLDLGLTEPEAEVAGLPAQLGEGVVPTLDAHSSSLHLLSGYPLCSAFGEFEVTSDAIFLHK